jgi:hypothetical protein
LQSDLPPLARASSVAYPGKTSHAQESSDDGITRRNRCIVFGCCGARDFTGSQARSQKSGDSNESFTVACQILSWRSVQAEKFCGSQSGSRDWRRRKEQRRRGSS